MTTRDDDVEAIQSLDQLDVATVLLLHPRTPGPGRMTPRGRASRRPLSSPASSELLRNSSDARSILSNRRSIARWIHGQRLPLEARRELLRGPPATTTISSSSASEMANGGPIITRSPPTPSAHPVNGYSSSPHRGPPIRSARYLADVSQRLRWANPGIEQRSGCPRDRHSAVR